MSQYSFFNDLNSAVSMDVPLKKGPNPRWQKKCLESSNSSINASINASMNTSKSSKAVSTGNKTPKKANSENKAKTPSKTPKKDGSGGITPNKGSKTPVGADRFIPTRNTSNFELGNFMFNQQQQQQQNEGDITSPSLSDKQKAMSENLHGYDINSAKILSFQEKAPAPPEGFQNSLKVIYSQSKTPHTTKSLSRYIPQAPDRILDAPDIMDDYYLNLVDWSNSNILGVALGRSIYLWNAGSGTIDQLTELEGQDYVCSLSWIADGELLAIGNSLGSVAIWDVNAKKRLRIMDGHPTRVSSLSWNKHILTSGCRSGLLVHHDVRQREHAISTIQAHSQEVCGLKWSTDGKYLASGGNDNMLCIWPEVAGEYYSQNRALHTFTAHQSAVKALAWCPWQPSLLASGGGTADRHIRFWNCNTGSSVASVDTRSQVCGILWSTNYKELISGHGFANNQLIIWKYPSLTKVTELTGHTARVLHLSMSPDGSTVLSAGADETLRLWNCFAPDPATKKSTKESDNSRALRNLLCSAKSLR